MTLTAEQRTRYDRNLRIPGLGAAGQERIGAGRVAVIGLGGLGSPAALYLAAAGVGTLGLFDADRVELSNLQRQILHSTRDIGRSKSESAVETVTRLNPEIEVKGSIARVTPENVDELIADYDVVVEASDNFETKFLLNDACLDRETPLATAGILALSGQAQFVVPGRVPCLRCVRPAPPRGVPTTSKQGVLGAVPGILGSLQAMEVLRYLAGIWEPLPGGESYLHRVDGENMRLRSLRIARRRDCRCAPLWLRS
jgi:molybdopterin/thiamine biosynthesis adenylyltransferase